MRTIALMTLCLTLLTACSSVPGQIVRTEYVYQQVPALPAAPDIYAVKWQKAGAMYSVDEVSAKALLKNWELQRGYAAELRAILDGLKNPEK